MTKGLDQRVAKLEDAAAKQIPDLRGKSAEELSELVGAALHANDSARLALLGAAMNEEQLDAIIELATKRIARRAEKPEAQRSARLLDVDGLLRCELAESIERAS